MNAHGDDAPANPPQQAADGLVDFRWQSLFQKSASALFVLNRRRRILFVNRAWEQATGLASAVAKGLQCRHTTLAPDAPLDLQVRALCAPPPEVLAGRAARVRRAWTGTGESAQWWEIDYLPIAGPDAPLAILGRLQRIEPTPHAGAESTLNVAPQLRATRSGFDSLTSGNASIGIVARQARLAAAIDQPYLIVGERGAGKRHLASVIHEAGPRRQNPLVVLACARLPLEQCRILLAAHTAIRMGWSGGTLFLQEPQALPLDLQRSLIDRMEAEAPAPGLRLAAGMRLEPGEAVQKGLLLPELACHLETLILRLPPLRERAEDLHELVDTFWKRIRAALARPDVTLARETRELLLRYSWPGNFHELERVLLSAGQHARGKLIEPGDLPARVRMQLKLAETPSASPGKPPPLDALLEQVERRMLVTAMRKAGGNKSKAAEWLGIWRARLIRRLEALGIDKEGDSP
jgi:DNA-binding NtrC family response regulator